MKRKLKKSSLALLLCLVLLGSSVGVYAATFDGTMEFSGTDYILGAASRTSTTSGNASFKITSWSYADSYTTFKVEDSSGIMACKSAVTVKNDNTEWKALTYSDTYKNSYMTFYLIGMTTSMYHGYSIGGTWDPNGR